MTRAQAKSFKEVIPWFFKTNPSNAPIVELHSPSPRVNKSSSNPKVSLTSPGVAPRAAESIKPNVMMVPTITRFRGCNGSCCPYLIDRFVSFGSSVSRSADMLTTIQNRTAELAVMYDTWLACATDIEESAGNSERISFL